MSLSSLPLGEKSISPSPNRSFEFRNKKKNLKALNKYELDDAELVDPIHDTLHRGLKARQISMIAVGKSIC